GYGHKRTTATGNNGQKTLGVAVEARTAGADAHICPILQYSNTSILPLHQFPRCLSVRARSRPFVVRSQSLTPSRSREPPRSPNPSYLASPVAELQLLLGPEVVQIARQNELERQLVRRVREREARAGLDVEGTDGMVDDGEQLVDLRRHRRDVTERSEIIILLGGHSPHRREVVVDARRGDEVETLDAALVLGVEDRIDDDVDRFQVPADDRPRLLGKAAVVPAVRVGAELEVHAIDERAIIGVRDHEQRPQLEAVVAPAESVVVAVERHVQTRLEPGRYAIRPLGDAVE